MFRAHQTAFSQLCEAIAAGRYPGVRGVICSITPGGGKSLLPVIAAHALIPAIADRIAWVVPRRSLQEQAEAEFAAGKSRDMVGNTHLIRKTTGEPDPCRGLSGFCTTYQAIGANNYFLQDEFAARRYVLVLDEPHHIEEGGAWERALSPLVRRAALTVFMSGTLERGNGKRIAYLPYGPSMNGELVDLTGRDGVAAIQYSRADALFDRAIVPIHFELMDGTASWVGTDGSEYSTTLSGAHKDTASAIYTALKTQFGMHLLNDCSDHWLEYRKTHPRSKLLVVTANIEDAKRYQEHLKERGVRSSVATSDDSALASRNIAKFKLGPHERGVDCLVTVAMAYEGLDVPPITHIACLTQIRSRPWIEQMLARATRFDAPAGPWEEQLAHVYVPDDKFMVEIIQRMQGEQLKAVRARLEADEDEEEMLALTGPPPEREESERGNITPLGSSGLGRRVSRIGEPVPRDDAASGGEPLRTPSQQEAELREQIQNYCKQVDALVFDRQWGETNKRVVKTFGQSRQHMPLEKLTRVMEWLEEYYPVSVRKLS